MEAWTKTCGLPLRSFNFEPTQMSIRSTLGPRREKSVRLLGLLRRPDFGFGAWRHNFCPVNRRFRRLKFEFGSLRFGQVRIVKLPLACLRNRSPKNGRVSIKQEVANVKFPLINRKSGTPPPERTQATTGTCSLGLSCS